MRSIIKIVLVGAGTLCVGMGVVGIFLPLIPTTPFLLLGAACYVKGSQKFYDKLLNNKILGTYIRNYREGKGIPLRTKVYAIMLLWISIGFSVVFWVNISSVRVVLLLIAVGVTWHISTIKNTIKTDSQDKEITDMEYMNK